MNLIRMLPILALVGLAPGTMFAGNPAAPIDTRLVGSWAFDNGFGNVLFHTSFANGDFKRTVYDRGKLVVVAKGTWYSDGHTFHIVILKRMTAANPGKFVNVEQHFDQEILDIAKDAYVVREPSVRGDGLIKWRRMGSADLAEYAADGPNQPPDSESIPLAPVSGTPPKQP
jgi:hypothetical protein